MYTYNVYLQRDIESPTKIPPKSHLRKVHKIINNNCHSLKYPSILYAIHLAVHEAIVDYCIMALLAVLHGIMEKLF